LPVAPSTVNAQIEAALGAGDPLRLHECVLWALEAPRRAFAPDEEWSIPWLDLLAQGRRSDQLPLGLLLSCLDGLSASWVVARLPKGPLSDEALEENRRILSELPGPFRADLVCASDADGVVSWDGSVGAPSFDEAELSSLPLEVGQVSPGTLFMHLVFSGGFFRWPYGSAWLYGCLADRPLWWAWRRRMMSQETG